MSSEFDLISEKLSGISKHKSYLKKIPEISMNIIALRLRIKPSLLWDFCCLDREKLISIVNLCFQSEAPCVLEINGDYLLFERNLMTKHLKTVVENPPLFIDISRENTEPFCVNPKPVCEMIENVLQQLEEDFKDQDFFSLEIDPSWNITTLYGVLLGFPVVYWFNNLQSSDNCLSCQDLVVHCLEMEIGRHRATPISFSVPRCVMGVAEQTVQEWWAGQQLPEEVWPILGEKKNFTINGLYRGTIYGHIVNLPFVTM